MTIKMTKLKFGLVALALVAGQQLIAQSVSDARKLLYYERFQSARDMLQKVVTGNPADAEAVYWLSQAEFGLHDPAAAKAALQKGMEGANSAHPLLLAGMGQAELAEGKVNDARQRFETAISLSKGKDVAVLNAIGKANLEKAGDAPYAIEKLKMATALYDAQKKGSKDPDVYITLGDAYRKIMDGGNAVTAYQNALVLDPKYAAAKYKIAKVYLTQGNEQKDIFVRNFEEAIEFDAKYAPAYYDLYTHYFTRDVYKATNLFNSYKANSDAGPAIDYEEASLLYASSEFKQAIDKAGQLLSTQGDKADARLYRLQAYSYDKLGDSVLAVEKLEKFFSVARPDQILPDNYVMMAMNSAKFPARQAQVDEYFLKAIDADTTVKNKIDYTRKAANFFKGVKNQGKAAEWFLRVMTVNPNPGKTDIFNAAMEHYRLGAYRTSDSVFKIYSGRYPDETFGHLWSYRSLALIDTTMEQGLAIPDCLKFIEVAEKQKDKNKGTLVSAYGYMAGYTADVKSVQKTDKLEKKAALEEAVGYIDRLLELDATNASAIKIKEVLTNRIAKLAAAPAKTGGN
jgi:tetratricopeptide (TPR) repeat protein